MGSNSILTFVQLQKGTSPQQVNDKIRGFIKKHVPDSVTELELALYSKIHLHQYFGYGRDMGQIKYVYIFSLIAFFVLLIACINFMNLSTARSANRAREVGVRKVVGALKSHIIRQFYGESVIYAFIALAFAVILVLVLMSPFNNLSGRLSKEPFDMSRTTSPFLAFPRIPSRRRWVSGKQDADSPRLCKSSINRAEEK